MSFLFAILLAASSPTPHEPLRQLEHHAAVVSHANKGFEQVFGPAPAVAASPFLGLAILAGAALVVDQPAFANSSLRDNVMLREARAYASWWLVAALILLALAGGAANSGKLQGSVGKVVRAAEGVLVGVAYVLVSMRALSSSSPTPSVLQASVIPAFDLGALTLMVTAGLALIAMMVVRFAFDVLIWLNPIPFIDLLFEAAKTIFSLLFFIVYFISPIATAIFGAILLIPVLFMLPWAMRLLGFVYRIVFGPLLAYMFPSFKPRLKDHTLATTMAGIAPTLFCRGHVLKARGFKKRQAVALVRIAGETSLQPIRRRKGTRALVAAGEQVVVGRTVGWIEVRVLSSEGQLRDHIALPYSLSGEYATLCALLGAYDCGHLGLLKALRGAGHKAKESIEAAAHTLQERIDAPRRTP